MVQIKWELQTGSRVTSGLTYGATIPKGIARKARQAATVGTVVDGTTSGIATTHSGTRIDTVMILTRLVQGTLAGNGTLGTTGRWCAHKVRQAATDGLLIGLAALRIGATRRGLARMKWHRITQS